MNSSNSTCPTQSLIFARCLAFVAAGCGLLAVFFLVSRLSARFQYGQGHAERPILAFVCWLMLAVLLHFAVLWIMLRDERRGLASAFEQRSCRWELAWLLLVFVGARVLLFDSNPIQEIDYARYLWDGAVLANGGNPYQYAPQELDTGEAHSPEIERLRRLRIRTSALLKTLPASITRKYPRFILHWRKVYLPFHTGLLRGACTGCVRSFCLRAWHRVTST